MSKLNLHTFAYLDVETTGLSPWFGYMVAHCHLRDEERNFRLDRIEQMEIEKQSSNQCRETAKS